LHKCSQQAHEERWGGGEEGRGAGKRELNLLAWSKRAREKLIKVAATVLCPCCDWRWDLVELEASLAGGGEVTPAPVSGSRLCPCTQPPAGSLCRGGDPAQTRGLSVLQGSFRRLQPFLGPVKHCKGQHCYWFAPLLIIFFDTIITLSTRKDNVLCALVACTPCFLIFELLYFTGSSGI